MPDPWEMRPPSEHWRGLEELELLREQERVGSPRAHPEAGEFPPSAVRPPSASEITRRAFLKVLGATGAAGLAGCIARAPAARIVPYATQPPEVTPGVPLFYSTALEIEGFASGVFVESREGRPVKVEGNPEHPASLGATGVHEQFACYQLYDPNRARALRSGREPSSWESFIAALSPAARGAALGREESGRGMHFLFEPIGSPLLARMIERLREAYPAAEVHFHAPLETGAAWEAARAAFGRAVAPQWDLRRAARVLALDADFLGQGPFHTRYERHFAERRRPGPDMSRLYVVEPSLTVTGAAADHRLARRAGDVPALGAAVLAEVVLGLGRRPPGAPAGIGAALERLRAAPGDAAFVKAVARDLAAGAGESLVIAGERQPAAAHAVAHLLNAALGSFGRTVSFSAPARVDSAAPDVSPAAGLERLLAAIDGGAVETLVIVGGNPVKTAPADLDFRGRLAHVRTSAYVGLYENQTGRAAAWFVPLAHDLESWGDARAYDGTATLVQPLIAPLFGGRTAAEVLDAFLAGGGARTPYDLVRDFWREKLAAGADFEAAWRRSLERGVVEGSASSSVDVAPRWEGVLPLLQAARGPAGDGIEIAFATDPAIRDGCFAHVAWLLELPHPITKLSWGNAALVSPRTAERLGVRSEDVLEIAQGGRTIRAPVFVLPGHADDAVTLPLGYGEIAPGARRPESGAPLGSSVGTEEPLTRSVGFDAYPLRTRAAPTFARGARVEPARIVRKVAPDAPPETERLRHALASTQLHWAIEGEREVVRRATLAHLLASPDPAPEPAAPRQLSLYEPPPRTGEQWAMAIDLTRCNGCNACVAACQAENNTPLVGKEGVLASREMYWLRIDRYFSGPPDAPALTFQPMLCQHCEQAPCEYVCPVNATTHSQDGLNEMSYNRCIGTRFCSNNCPWKVRRFNWFDYNGAKTETEKMSMNPDVTVRERGVMEKCTFCVQRIRGAEIAAKVAGKTSTDGAFETACQQACPSRAIVFGSIADEKSRVAALWRDRRAYAALGELGTRPRVRYLTKVTNPNAELGS